MCYGMGCSREEFDTGTCADPRHCAVAEQERAGEERARRIAGLRATPYLCPDCDEHGVTAYLKRDGQRYICPQCGTDYAPAALLAAYQGMYDDLISDAEWTAARMDDLRADHPALAADAPQSPAPAAPEKAA